MPGGCNADSGPSGRQNYFFKLIGWQPVSGVDSFAFQDLFYANGSWRRDAFAGGI